MTPSPPLGRWWGTLYITTLQGAYRLGQAKGDHSGTVQCNTAAAWATYEECTPCVSDHAKLPPHRVNTITSRQTTVAQRLVDISHCREGGWGNELD